jgi:6-phospho-beta-glucosidase
MKKITIIGGGIFAAKLIESLAAEEGMPELELRLSARRFPRLQAIAKHAAMRIASKRPDWRVEAFSNLPEALNGTDAVVVLVRVGGLAARSRDERFPREFGFAGDEGLGLGGAANAWRSFPVLSEISQTIQEHAPQALLLNMVAPLGVTTRLFAENTEAPVLGVCELPFVTRVKWEGEKLGQLHYAGLNHLGWFWGEKDSLDAGIEQGEIAEEILQRYGAAPLHYFYRVFEVEIGKRLGFAANPDRALELMDLGDSIFEQMRSHPGSDIPDFDQRPTPWFDQALSPVLSAMLGTDSWTGTVNLPNKGHLKEVGDGVVVEVAANLAQGDVDVLPCPPPPPKVSEFLEAIGHFDDLLYHACSERKPALIKEALRYLPLPLKASDLDAISDAVRAPV